MGEVYDAHDRVKHRDVALKLLPAGLAADPVFRERFEREARVAAKLQEPHIIPIHDFGEIDGTLFIDMRKVNGQNLLNLLSGGRLPAQQALSILSQVGAALDAAHQQGLVHRDVKPENILVTASGFAYLADFGIAFQQGDRGLTQVGTAIGSLAYMAPERFDGVNNLPASDIYSLGCVFVQMLTGSAPYGVGTSVSMMKAHLTARPPKLSAHVPGIPPGIDPVIDQALAKDPTHRQSSASELSRQAEQAFRAAGHDTAAAARTAPAWALADTQPASIAGTATTPQAPVPAPAPGPARPRAWKAPVAVLLVIVAVLGVGAIALALRSGGSPHQSAASTPGGVGHNAVPGATRNRPVTSSPAAPPASQSRRATPSSASPNTSSEPTDAVSPLPGTAYMAYHNARFGFTARVPKTMTMAEAHENGNGATFVSADSKTTLEVSGQNNTNNETANTRLRANEADIQNTDGRITYKTLVRNGYAISGYDKYGDVFYRREFVYSNVIYELSWSYPAADKSRLDAAVTETSNTFSPGPNKSA